MILREATVLFAKRGFEASTMQELANRVGITAAGLYYHFHSKQGLLFEVLESALEDVITAVAEAVEAADAIRWARPTAELHAFVHRHVTFQIEEREETELYSAAFYGSRHMLNPLSKKQRARLKELQKRSFDLLRRILRDGVEAGEFTIGDLTPTAFAIIAMGEYVPIWFKPGGRLTLDDLGDLYAELALRIVGATPSVLGAAMTGSPVAGRSIARDVPEDRAPMAPKDPGDPGGR